MAIGIVNTGGSAEQKALTLQLNGTTAASYDGSEPKSVNVTPASIGLGNVDNTHDADKTVKKADTADSVEWSSVKNKPSSYPPSSHTHNYAGSSSAGGAADSANKLNSLGAKNAQTGRTQEYGDVYTYNSNGEAHEGMPAIYTSTIGFGRGEYGTVEICGEWTGAQGLWARALRDTIDNWYDWQRIYTSRYHPNADYATSAGSVAWSAITGKPSSFTPSSHTHDDRYYTESEMNTKLAGKSDTSHTHAWSVFYDFNEGESYSWGKCYDDGTAFCCGRVVTSSTTAFLQYKFPFDDVYSIQITPLGASFSNSGFTVNYFNNTSFSVSSLVSQPFFYLVIGYRSKN